MATCLSSDAAPCRSSHSPALSLDDVPLEYIIQQLRNLAPHYWNKPELADCTIIVPIPHAQGKPIHPTIAVQLPPRTLTSVSSMFDPSSLGRRATEPTLNFIPRISLKLHMDYISTHSSYIRALLSGANPLDLVHTTSTIFNDLRSSRRFVIPTNRLPRLISGTANHPILYLPVPDPSSFHLLVHWIYFGDTTYIDQCLRQGVIHWEGIARNVEYLGLSHEIKIFLRQWYFEDKLDSIDYEDDSDTTCTDLDSYFEGSDSSTISVIDDADTDTEEDEEPSRGRPRIRRPLSYQEPGIGRWYQQ